MIHVHMGNTFEWFFFFKQKTAYELRISAWSSYFFSSDLELRLVAVGGFVQVDVHQETTAQRLHQLHERCRFARRATGVERTVRIDRVGVPAMDALIGPGAHARRHQQVRLACVVRAVAICEQDRKSTRLNSRHSCASRM